MEYKKILGEQARKLNIAYKYWPLYLYHFSDIHNIVHILYEGIILSRNEAKTFIIRVTKIKRKLEINHSLLV